MIGALLTLAVIAAGLGAATTLVATLYGGDRDLLAPEARRADRLALAGPVVTLAATLLASTVLALRSAA